MPLLRTFFNNLYFFFRKPIKFIDHLIYEPIASTKFLFQGQKL